MRFTDRINRLPPGALDALIRDLGEECTPLNRSDWKEVTGRNDPCPCGSRRKFKHCCLRGVAHDRS